MCPVATNGVDKQGIDLNGVQVKQSLSDANETVNKGVYDPTTLSTVDADLAIGNIKSGITIFGFAGSTNVLDISDANATVAQVLAPNTFYAVGPPKKTGTMPTVALNPALNSYPAGYHAGAVSLTAVDADLATGNIKSGITIFGVAGKTEVVDTTTGSPIAAIRMRTSDVGWANGIQYTGSGTKTLSPANDTVNEGYYVATTLHAVDADLASANIKSGITIFGLTGPATVQDISAANATVAQVLASNTFFSVSGTIKTGTMPTVALAAGNSAYPTGYHAGAASLQAVDANLAVGNIKSGINIFGFVGTYDNSATPILATDIKTGEEGWVNGTKVTGSGTKTLNPANDTVNAGYYAATTLHAVDADLAVGNIKLGVTIFGFVGTYGGAGVLSQDALNQAYSTLDTSGGTAVNCKYVTKTGDAEYDLATCTTTFNAASMTVGVATAELWEKASRNDSKFRLYMDGTLVTETALSASYHDRAWALGTRALSGSKICKATLYVANAAGQVSVIGTQYNGVTYAANASIAVGSIKIT